MAVPALVLVLAVSLSAIDLGIAQVRCVDAARIGARLLSRGEPRGTVLEEVLAAAPNGARVDVATSDGKVTVTVVAPLPRVLSALSGVGAPRASAVARLEAMS